MIIRHDKFLPFYQKNHYSKFLVTKNCIKKDLEIYIFNLIKRIVQELKISRIQKFRLRFGMTNSINKHKRLKNPYTHYMNF